MLLLSYSAGVSNTCLFIKLSVIHETEKKKEKKKEVLINVFNKLSLVADRKSVV